MDFYRELLILWGAPGWRAGADCNSVVLSLNRFDSYHPTIISGSSSVGRASTSWCRGSISSSARLSRCSSVVERVLGKDEAVGSIPIVSSSVKKEINNKNKSVQIMAKKHLTGRNHTLTLVLLATLTTVRLH